MLGVRDRKNIIKSSTFHLSSGSTPRLLHFQKPLHGFTENNRPLYVTVTTGWIIPIKIQMQFLVFNYKMKFYNFNFIKYDSVFDDIFIKFDTDIDNDNFHHVCMFC